MILNNINAQSKICNIEERLFDEIYGTLRYVKMVGENRTIINVKKLARDLFYQINLSINNAYEEGWKAAFEELEEENKKLLQGFAYKKS